MLRCAPGGDGLPIRRVPGRPPDCPATFRCGATFRFAARILIFPRPSPFMLFRLLVAFICVPLIELYLLLRLADATSPMTTFGIVIATGLIGSYLARREGLAAWKRFRESLAAGGMPGREIQDGLMIVFAAALLLTPGLLTDAVGFALLIPAGRNFVRRNLMPRIGGGGAGFRVHTFVRGDATDDSADGPGFGGRRVRDDPMTIDAEAVHRR